MTEAAKTKSTEIDGKNEQQINHSAKSAADTVPAMTKRMARHSVLLEESKGLSSEEQSLKERREALEIKERKLALNTVLRLQAVGQSVARKTIQRKEDQRSALGVESWVLDSLKFLRFEDDCLVFEATKYNWNKPDEARVVRLKSSTLSRSDRDFAKFIRGLTSSWRGQQRERWLREVAAQKATEREILEARVKRAKSMLSKAESEVWAYDATEKKREESRKERIARKSDESLPAAAPVEIDAD